MMCVWVGSSLRDWVCVCVAPSLDAAVEVGEQAVQLTPRSALWLAERPPNLTVETPGKVLLPVRVHCKTRTRRNLKHQQEPRRER